MNRTNEFQIYGEIMDGNCLYSEIIRNQMEFQKDWKNRPFWPLKP